MFIIVGLMVFCLTVYCNSSCSEYLYYVEINGECYECPSGLYGQNCSLACPPDFYGYECKEKCNCPVNMFCHAMFGCVSLEKNGTRTYIVENIDQNITRSVPIVDDGKIWSMDIATWYTISLVSSGFAVVMAVISCTACALRRGNDLRMYHPKHLVDMLSLVMNGRTQPNHTQSNNVTDTNSAGNNYAGADDLQTYLEIDESFPPPQNMAPTPPPAASKPIANVEVEVEYLEPGPSRKNLSFKSTKSDEDKGAFSFYNSLTLRSNSSTVMSEFAEYAEVKKSSFKGKGKGKGKGKRKSKLNPIKRISQLVTDAYHSRASDKHYDLSYKKDSINRNVYINHEEDNFQSSTEERGPYFILEKTSSEVTDAREFADIDMTSPDTNFTNEESESFPLTLENDLEHDKEYPNPSDNIITDVGYHQRLIHMNSVSSFQS